MRTRVISTIALLLILGACHPMAAQTDRATIEGTVTDPSGATIANSKVQITRVETGLGEEKVTNNFGHYRFPAIAVGVYTVGVTRDGFQTKQIEGVEVQVGETRTLDVVLSVGAVSEKVVVKAEAAPYERSTAASATVIRDDQIGDLPVNGRDWAGLTLLAPFAQDDGGGDQRTIRFAGRARDDNNFNFDGVDAGGIQEQAQKSQTRLQISEDAVEEYRVSSALYDAEYGTQAGGQINVVTKSGTNEFHGTAFGYLRNSVFDARNFNDPAGVAPFRLGQYGLTLGGPLIKEKTFFFVGYEGLRQLQASTSISNVPSAAFLNEVLVTGKNGAGPSPQMCSIMQAYPWRKSTGTVGGCAPRFAFPDSLFSPLVPDLAPPDSGDAEVFTRPFPTTVHEDTWLVRVDHNINETTTLYGRVQRDISLVDAPNSLQNALDQTRTINHPANYLLALQHTFAANLLNETKVYVNREPFHNPQSSVLPYSVSSNNFETINNNQADIEVGTTFGLIDNLTWTRGRHTFKTGIEFRRIRLNQGKTASNTLTFADDTSMVSASLSQVQFTAPWCCHKLRRLFEMPYFQDEWKMTPTLTATLGIRWDYYGVEHEADNATTVFDLNQFHGICLGSNSRNVPVAVAPINTPPCPRNPALYNPNYRNFDPRVSLAWAPGSLHGHTVIRSGFGIYHGAAQNDDLNAGLESDTFTGVAQNVALGPALEQAVPDLTGFSNAANAPRALQRQGRRDLYAEEWGLTIDHELPADFLLTAAYLGSHGVRLFSRGAVNLCITAPDVNGNCVRPLDQYYPAGDPFSSVDIKRDIGSSSYHALELSLERRFTNGISFQTRYTFSHSINDGSVGGGESNGPQNVNCLPCDKGPSIYDVRHNIAANGVYEFPIGPGKAYLNQSGAWGKVFEGWGLSGVGLWHTGHPLTVKYNVQPSQLPDGNDQQTDDRPDIVPGVPLYLPGGGKNGLPWINPNAFQAPPQNLNPNTTPGAVTRFGNAGNGIVRALNSWQVDMALVKETKLTERFALEFGIQAFNVFNHVQLGDPSTLKLDYVRNPNGPGYITQAGSGFGVINGTVNFNNNNDNAASPNTGTGLPRQLQFMLRAKF
jgi:hypothetical protein